MTSLTRELCLLYVMVQICASCNGMELKVRFRLAFTTEVLIIEVVTFLKNSGWNVMTSERDAVLFWVKKIVFLYAVP